MNPQEIITLITARDYLALAIVIVGYFARLMSDKSRFPISVSPRWQPVIVVVLGQTYAALTVIAAGTPWQQATINGLVVALFTMGLFDLVVKAIFNGREPSWMAWFAMVRPPPKEDAGPDEPRNGA